jgi:hypothetical protein
MLVHTRSTLRYIPEDGILHSHRHENLKPYSKCCLAHIILDLNGRLFQLPTDLLHMKLE